MLNHLLSLLEDRSPECCHNQGLLYEKGLRLHISCGAGRRRSLVLHSCWGPCGMLATARSASQTSWGRYHLLTPPSLAWALTATWLCNLLLGSQPAQEERAGQVVIAVC